MHKKYIIFTIKTSYNSLSTECEVNGTFSLNCISATLV
jgi:hypothetical protein